MIENERDQDWKKVHEKRNVRPIICVRCREKRTHSSTLSLLSRNNGFSRIIRGKVQKRIDLQHETRWLAIDISLINYRNENVSSWLTTNYYSWGNKRCCRNNEYDIPSPHEFSLDTRDSRGKCKLGPPTQVWLRAPPQHPPYPRNVYARCGLWKFTRKTAIIL